MRLSRPIYEILPLIYAGIGGIALLLSYLDPIGGRAALAFVIGLAAEIAALTLSLRRLNDRALNREYSSDTRDLP